VVKEVQVAYRVAERRACRVLGFARSSFRYQSRRDPRAERGKPQSIRVDNGLEVISRSLDLWACFNSVKLDFTRPGKPTDNAVIESVNGRLRDECLNQHWFLSLDEAKRLTGAWREDYHRVRLHASLGHRTPFEFARRVDEHARLPALSG
jgi:transposase InsO family protein